MLGLQPLPGRKVTAIHRATVLAAMLALSCHAVFAQDHQAATGGRGATSRRIRTHGTPRPDASGHLLSDFIKGSPAQQDLERRDNDLATMRPLDHRKDDFFSDWRGLR